MNLSSFVIPPWVQWAWKLLPWGGCLGLGVALALAIAGHRVDRANWERDGAKAEARAAVIQAANEARKVGAIETHERTTMQMQPIILNSKAAADAYAQTPAGRAPCLSVDRVRSILATREPLFAFTPARSAGPVPAGPTLPYDLEQR